MSRLRLPAPAKNKRHWLSIGLLIGLVLVWHWLLTPAHAAHLGNRSMQLSNNDISTTSDYLLAINLTTAGPLGSIRVQFCSNDPLPGTPCTAPSGFDDTAAMLASQSGPSGFSISGASTANQIILSRPVSNAPAGAAEYHFTGITNPSSPGPYFVRIQTYATNDASGPATDYGGIAFYITNSLAISAEVPPYLLFCTGVTISGLNCTNAIGDYIDFGLLSSHKASSASSQMVAATNAIDGYTITVSGTTMTSGNNIINALSASNVSRPGIGQFGFNLRANVAPPKGSDPTGPGSGTPRPNYNQPNIYRFVSGDTIASFPAPDDVREYTASYIANVPSSQAPGIYVATLTYICLGDF